MAGFDTLPDSKNYKITYENNIEPGTATMTITGKGNYTGTLVKTFTITKYRIKSTDIKLEFTEKTYTGQAMEPKVTVTAHYGIENIPVPMTPDGPDMDVVQDLVENDPQVKGIWCVPKYSNPQGYTYSDETVRRFAALKPAAPDFRVFWDNAYIVHDLYDEGDELLNIFDALAEAGNDDLVYEFASTAKVTFPGSGLAFVAASDANMADIRAHFSAMRVCPEKISQFAHVAFLRDAAGVREHMRRHAQILRPRFQLVEDKLSAGLGDLGVATWTKPRGGYFVSFEGPEGSAKAIVALAKELGVTMTGAGATWPYKQDPHDTNIRIAPTFPTLDELGAALDVFVLCVKLVSARLALAEK